jgi:hypothetical protein
MRKRELTRGRRPSPLAGRTVAAGAGEQVIGTGEQPAGDRRGGDLLAAAPDDTSQAGAKSGCRPTVCAASHSTHRTHTGPCLEICPCRTVRSLPRIVGVSPPRAASLRAEPKRLMPPISASRTSAVNGPTPGSRVSTLTRGSAFTRCRTSSSSRPVSWARAPVSARPSSMTSRDRRQLQRGQPPPTRPAHPAALRPAMAVTGTDRVDPVAQQRPQPDQLRPVPQHRPQLPHLRRGEPAAFGSRSARSSCTSVAAPTLSFFSRAEAIALHCSGRRHVRLEAVVLQQPPGSHPQPNAASYAAGVPAGSPRSRPGPAPRRWARCG